MEWETPQGTYNDDNKVEEAYLIANVIMNSILLAASLLVGNVMCVRRAISQLPKSLKASLFLYLVQSAASIAFYLYMLCKGYTYTDIDCMPLIDFMIREVSLVIWTLNQWLFTSHYLKVACLIRLTFARHSLESITEMKRRLKWLTAIDFAAYSGFAIVFFYSFYAG